MTNMREYVCKVHFVGSIDVYFVRARSEEHAVSSLERKVANRYGGLTSKNIEVHEIVENIEILHEEEWDVE